MRNELAEQHPYQGYIDHHLRIGDTYLYVPPTAISVSSTSEVQRGYTMRSKSLSPKSTGYFRRIIDMELYFIGEDYLRGELRELLRQIRLIPFIPIENRYLNEVHRIEGIAVKNFVMSTVPGFPNAIRVNLEAEEFDPFVYIASAENEGFEDIINWDLYHWYYSRGLEEFDMELDKFFGARKGKDGNKDMSGINDLFIHSKNEYHFSVVDEGFLEELNGIRKARNAEHAQYQEEKLDPKVNKEQAQIEHNSKMDDLTEAYEEMRETGAEYDEVYFPGLNLTHISAHFTNILSPIQLQAHQSPTFQFLGATDTGIRLEFETIDEEVVGALVRTMDRVKYLSRKYRMVNPSGGLRFHHPLTNLLGTRNVIVEDMNIYTSSEQVGLYRIAMTLVSYNSEQEKQADIDWISSNLKTNTGQSSNIFKDLFNLATLPYTVVADPLVHGTDTEKWRVNQLLKNNTFTSSGFYKNVVSASAGAYGSRKSKDLQDKIGHENAVKGHMATLNLYPDLDLPTFDEVASAGFSLPNPDGGIYVDPDFYYIYGEDAEMRSVIKKVSAAAAGADSVFRDGAGGTIGADGKMTPGGKDSGGEVEAKSVMAMEAPKTAYEKKIKDYEGFKFNKDDKNKNKEYRQLSKEDTLKVLKAKSDEFGVPFELSLAAASYFDKDMKQFYNSGLNTDLNHIYSENNSTPKYIDKTYTHSLVDMKDNKAFVGSMNVPRKAYGESEKDMVEYDQVANIDKGVRYLSNLYKSNLSKKQVNNSTGNEDRQTQIISGLKEHNFLYEGGEEIDKNLDIATITLAQYFDLDRTLFNIKEGDIDRHRPEFKMVEGLSKHYIDSLEAADDAEMLDSIQRERKERERKEGVASAESGETPIKDITEDPIEEIETPEKAKEKKEKEEKEQAAKSEGAKTNSTFLESSKTSEDGSLHDIYKYDKRGRMIRAFPTFLMLFIDEGKYVGSVKMNDHFFHYHLIESISFTRNRKDSTASAEVLLNNFTGSLNDNQKIAEGRQFGFGDFMKQVFKPGYQAEKAAESRERGEDYYKSIYLSTGTRVHLRMGYGSSPLGLPIIMNGPITNIESQEEYMQLKILDDGHELANKLKTKPDDFSDAGLLWAKKEPTDIVDDILTDKKGLFSSLLDATFDNHSHSHGIMHFGETNTMGATLEKVTGNILTGGPLGPLFLGKDGRKMAEINLNIYQTTGLDNDEHNKLWNKITDQLGIGKADEDGIRINLFDKTTWDVLNITAAIGHDHHVAVHPFDFRNTIFSGKLHFPIIYGYGVGGDSTGVMRKTFRQYRFYDSYTTIIHNGIKAQSEDLKTVAAGYYMDNGKMKTTPMIYADKSIVAERQKLVNIDTTLNAKGAWLLDKIPIVGKMINKPIKWKQDQGVALKITMAGLRDYMKDMYDGYLTTMGDPAAKPFDMFWLTDDYIGMNGPAEIKEVTHMMSMDTGFISLIKPDIIAVNRDTTAINEAMSLSQFATGITFAFLARYVSRMMGYNTHTPIMNGLWALTKMGGKKIWNASGIPKGIDFTKGKYQNYMSGKTLAKINEAGDIAKINKALDTNLSMGQLKRMIESGQIHPGDLRKIQDTISPTIITRGKNAEKSARLFLTAKIKEALASSKTFGKAKEIKNLASVSSLLTKVKTGWKAGRLLRATNPIGWLTLAIEGLVVATTAGFVGELIERQALQNRAVILLPLKRGSQYFVAGIEGHQGSVVGDTPTFTQKMMSQGITGLLANFMFDVDQSLWDVPEGYSDSLIHMSESSSSGSSTGNLYMNLRPDPPAAGSGGGRDIVSDAIENLGKDAEEKETERKRRSFREFLKDEWEKVKKKVKEWFTGFFKKMKDWATKFVNKRIEELKDWWKQQLENNTSDDGGGGSSSSSNSNSDACVKDMNGPPAGKAVGLSHYFKVLGPKIQKEAKKQGVQAYTEVLKAITMRESGGNYLMYPDVMQASESRGLPPNSIRNVDLSIKYGVEAFKKNLKTANYDLMTVFQAYNYGPGFVAWLNKGGRGGKYTKQLAWDFAVYMVNTYGRISSIPPGYGDSQYAQRVLKENFNGKLPQIKNCNSSNSSSSSSSSSRPSKNNSSNSGRSSGQVEAQSTKLERVENLPKTQGPSLEMEVVSTRVRRFEDYAISKNIEDNLPKEGELLKVNALDFSYSGGSMSDIKGEALLRKGAYQRMKALAKVHSTIFGEEMEVLEMYNSNSKDWTSTGWAFRIKAPDGVIKIKNRYQYINKSTHEEVYALIERAVLTGYRMILLGDFEIANRINRAFKNEICKYEPRLHQNMITFSYPTKIEE